MNLILDLGNTQTKAAVFLQKKMVKKYVFQKDALNEIKNLLIRYPGIKQGIVSSVVDEKQSAIHYLKKQINIVALDHKTKIPLSIRYKTPNTLGKDRIAAAVGALALFPKKNILIIDAGTCIKYNVLTSKSEFIGGAISPGLAMRYKALHHFTDKLPLLTIEKKIKNTIGTSTSESIKSGVQRGALFEIEGYIHLFKKEYKQGIVLLTGGDAHFLANALKNSIFAAPDLILSGLNEILLYQHS
ncbi:MAG: type III pantothenate kinase [Bacteroidetes bacterium]|nr:type III pantothenate kinase [Bacteroidota bacterium]